MNMQLCAVKTSSIPWHWRTSDVGRARCREEASPPFLGAEHGRTTQGKTQRTLAALLSLAPVRSRN